MITALDPCLSTIVSSGPSTIENFVAFAGYNTSSIGTYTFNDTTSFARTLITDSSDFCGDKAFTFLVNTTLTTQIFGSNNGKIYFNPPSGTTNFGVGQATL